MGADSGSRWLLMSSPPTLWKLTLSLLILTRSSRARSRVGACPWSRKGSWQAGQSSTSTETLVNTNYQHALAWFRALRSFDITRPMWRLHRGVGMGGDLVVSAVAERKVEEAHGDDLREAWQEEFEQLIGEMQPFEGAHELLAEVKERGLSALPRPPSDRSRSTHRRRIVLAGFQAARADDGRPAKWDVRPAP